MPSRSVTSGSAGRPSPTPRVLSGRWGSSPLWRGFQWQPPSLTEQPFCTQGDMEAQTGAKTCPMPRSNLASSSGQARLCSHLWANGHPGQGQAYTYTPSPSNALQNVHSEWPRHPLQMRTCTGQGQRLHTLGCSQPGLCPHTAETHSGTGPVVGAHGQAFLLSLTHSSDLH